MAPQSEVRLAEVVAALALSTDLATGLPLEHSLRRTLVAVWLGAESGLDGDDLRDAYYVALLGSVGCVLDGAALARFVADDIVFRADMFELDMTKPMVALRYLARTVGRGEGPVRRAASLIGMATQTNTVCREVAVNVGGLLDLGPVVRQALGQCDEHWNGKSSVLGLSGEQISIHARLFRLAQDIDVFNRSGGMDVAVAVVRARSGSYYDPRLAELFVTRARGLRSRLEVPSVWDAVLAAEPEPPRTLAAAEFDALAAQIANFIDMRSQYTVGHSIAVATLAEAAAYRLDLGADDARTLRAAGLLHDLGRAGIPVSLWDKRGPLTAVERDRLERHPALTEVVLARSASLGRLGTLAGLHHERLDGSGYRGVTATSLPITARVLAVADAYQSKLEPRPYRKQFTPGQAAAWVRDQAAAGKFDGEAARAVLDVGGHGDMIAAGGMPSTLPAGLTKREVEVLRLIVRGMSNREIAESLFLSPKTVGRHVETIYTKTTVTTRVGATLFAIEHGLVARTSEPIRP
jgi:HD-GYP domain-containing protein (c-di-GMP phosphodiesterase class II)/DNA-binding CsgD family transcriptional regulator